MGFSRQEVGCLIFFYFKYLVTFSVDWRRKPGRLEIGKEQTALTYPLGLCLRVRVGVLSITIINSWPLSFISDSLVMSCGLYFLNNLFSKFPYIQVNTCLISPLHFSLLGAFDQGRPLRQVPVQRRGMSQKSPLKCPLMDCVWLMLQWDTRQTVVEHNRNRLHWRELNEGLFWAHTGRVMVAEALPALYPTGSLSWGCSGVLACPWPQRPQVLGWPSACWGFTHHALG